MPLRQPFTQRNVKIRRVGRQVGRKSLHLFVKRRKMVTMALKRVAQPVERRRATALTQALDQVRFAAHVGKSAVEPLQHVANGRVILRDVDNLIPGHASVPGKRIIENLSQSPNRRLTRSGGEVAHIDIIGVRQAQQHLRRHWSLVALKMIEIARRNADFFGHACLAQAQFPAEHPQSRA